LAAACFPVFDWQGSGLLLRPGFFGLWTPKQLIADEKVAMYE